MKSSVIASVFALSLISLSHASEPPSTAAYKALYIYKEKNGDYGGTLATNESSGALECKVSYNKNNSTYSGILINNNYFPEKWGPKALPENEAKQHYLELLAQDPEVKN